MRLGPFYSLTVNCKFVHLFSKHLLVICASDNMTQARMMKVKVLLDRLRCEAYLAYTMAEAVGQMHTMEFDIIAMNGYSFRLVSVKW